MTQRAYPLAQTAAGKIHEHFKHHLSMTVLPQDKVGSLPDVDMMAEIIDATFWASLRQEEGYDPRMSLAFVSREQVENPLLFERTLPLDPQALTRLAPAVERPGIHLGVWRDEGELRVWGATRHLPALCFVLEVFAPGLLVIKLSRTDESGKFINVAVLHGDELKVIDEHAASVPDCPALLTSLLGLESQFASAAAVNVLIQLAVSTRAHGRGGTLLVVPARTDAWLSSILHPITYSVSPSFTVLADLMQTDAAERKRRSWQDALTRAVDGIAGLTAVDGAAIINSEYELLAFGAKIVRRSGWPQVGQVMLTEPIEGADAMVADPAQIGGTRHLSAAQFVQDQRDAIALVASQDGRFTVFAWSPCDDMVHAHRIDSLLL